MLFHYILKSLPSKQTSKQTKQVKQAKKAEPKLKMSTYESIQKENAELRQMVEKHANEIEQCKSVVYQLVGGLFNQRTQKWMGKSHTDVLMGNKYEPPETKEEEEEIWAESIWPTTRQGDKNEERIRKMEETIKQLEERILNFEKRLL